MGKFLGWLFVIIIVASGGAYYYYTKTGYKFGLEDTFLFKRSIGATSLNFIIQTKDLNRVSFDRFIEGHVLATGSLVGTYTRKP